MNKLIILAMLSVFNFQVSFSYDREVILRKLKTINEFRKFRLSEIPEPKPFILDTDRYIWGTITLEINEERIKYKIIKDKLYNKERKVKVKVTYLDYVIWEEEDIS